MKYLMPLLLINLSGFADEPVPVPASLPVPKSKAVKELIKHPEFKKAMEAAPAFTKAVINELDKYAPKLPETVNFWGQGLFGKEPAVIKSHAVWEEAANAKIKGLSKKEVYSLLGKPISFRTFATNTTRWVYRTNFICEFGVERWDFFVVHFDRKTDYDKASWIDLP